MGHPSVQCVVRKEYPAWGRAGPSCWDVLGFHCTFFLLHRGLKGPLSPTMSVNLSLVLHVVRGPKGRPDQILG